MCGVVGRFAYQDQARPIARDDFLNMRDRMTARGPDDAGFWESDDGRVMFGHRRLAIIDLSPGGHQPMHTPDGRFTIVFNGEIYNFQAIKNRLSKKGVHFASTSDTEVILALFARDGVAAFAQLRGMFAIAIWDHQAQTMTLARDPYGIKPLYYALADGNLLFASQVKALAQCPAVSRDVDAAALASYFTWGSVQEPRTILRDVRALPAGHHLTIRRGQVGEPIAFCTLPEIVAASPPRSEAELHEALRDSVRHHLIADVEVGCFLSSGVDSSAMIALMRDCGVEHIRAITLQFAEFAGQPQDETPLAQRVADYYGVSHHVRTVTAQEFGAHADQIIYDMDQPSVDGINTWFVSIAAKEIGLKVALSGLGGDELLGGYNNFTRIPATMRQFGGIARLPLIGPLANAAAQSVAPLLPEDKGKAAALFAYSRDLPHAYLLRRSVKVPSQLVDLLGRDLAHHVVMDGQMAALRALYQPDPGSDVARIALLEAGQYMRNQLLRDSDWAGMAHSLEIRVPLVDTELLGAFGAYQRNMVPGDGKRLLAMAPRRPLPDFIVNRPKTGFSIPVNAWIGNKGNSYGDWSRNVLARYGDDLKLDLGKLRDAA